MKKQTLWVATVLATSTLFQACSDDDDATIVSPGNPQQMSAALSVKVNGADAQRQAGDLPDPVGGESAPKISGLVASSLAVNGDTVPLSLDVDSESPLTRFLVKVVGSNDFLSVNLGGTTKVMRSLSLDLGVPSNVGDGTFCIEAVAEDDASRVSDPAPSCVTVESTADDQPTPVPTAQPSPTAAPTPSPSPSTAPSTTPSPSPSAAPSPSAEPSGTPSPTPSPTPPAGGTGSAAACFNQTLLTTGAQYTQTFRATTADGTADFTDERTVGGDTTFDGRPARETTGTTTTSVNGQTTTANTRTYTQFDFGVPSSNSIGVITEASFAGGSSSTTIVIEPGILQRLNLSPGDSYTNNHTTTVTTEVSTAGGTFPTETTTEFTRTVTYVGRSTATVPAGTFNTCRIDTSETATTNGETSSSSSVVHIGVGNGLPILTITDGNDRIELVDASINGQPVR